MESESLELERKPLTDGEAFFLEKIRLGARLCGKVLSERDEAILKTALPVNPLVPARKAKEEIQRAKDQVQGVIRETFAGMDQAQWTRRMLEALKAAYDHDLRTWDEARRGNPGKSSDLVHPPSQWTQHLRELYRHSNLILSGVVQGWYFACFRRQTRPYTFWGSLARRLGFPGGKRP